MFLDFLFDNPGPSRLRYYIKLWRRCKLVNRDNGICFTATFVSRIAWYTRNSMGKMGENVPEFHACIRCKNFDDERKRAILLHSLGSEGQRIFYSLPELEKDTKGKIKIEPGETFTDTDNSVYVQSLLMLERHFKPSQNKLTARIKFKQRSHLPGETVDEFLLALRQLIVPCDYPHAVEDELVRDQFVQFCKTPFF